MMEAMELSTSFLLPLASAAARSCAVAGIAALALAAFRVKATSIRLFTWTAVLYVALAMPLLQLVLTPLPVPMPSMLQTPTPQAFAAQPQPSRAPGASPVDIRSAPQARVEVNIIATPRHSWWSELRWNSIAAAAYMAVLAILLARVFAGVLLERRLRRASRVIADDRLTGRIAHSVGTHRLRFVPEALESDLVSVPLTMGILRPALLFPSNWCDWDDARLNAVVAHEMSHVARRDSLSRRLSLLHRAIFWFSPLAWWLDRHLAELAECASDEAALAFGVDRETYARTLLNFLESLQGVRRRVRWQGISMASNGRAERRMDRIFSWKGSVMKLKKSVVVLVMLLAVPVVYLAASAQPSRNGTSQTAPVEVAQAKTTTSPASAPHGKHGARRSSETTSYAFSDDDDLRYVIVSGKEDSFTMSGMRGDGEHVQELKKTIPGDFIWFRRDGKSYIIRDQATVRRAQAFWAPQAELGKQQEELGRQQEELGKQQEELSRQMEDAKVEVPDMSKALEDLQAELKKMGPTATSEQIGQLQEKIGALQEEIGESQSKVGDVQSKLGDQMGALGEKQGKLGEQQGRLGEQQGKLAEEASHKMKSLLDESLAKGTAQPEK